MNTLDSWIQWGSVALTAVLFLAALSVVLAHALSADGKPDLVLRINRRAETVRKWLLESMVRLYAVALATGVVTALWLVGMWRQLDLSGSGVGDVLGIAIATFVGAFLALRVQRRTLADQWSHEREIRDAESAALRLERQREFRAKQIEEIYRLFNDRHHEGVASAWEVNREDSKWLRMQRLAQISGHPDLLYLTEALYTDAARIQDYRSKKDSTAEEMVPWFDKMFFELRASLEIYLQHYRANGPLPHGFPIPNDWGREWAVFRYDDPEI